MTVPCESKPEIEKLQGQQVEFKEGQNEMEFRLRMQGEHIAQIKDASLEMVSGFKDFAREMRETVSDIKDKQIRDDMETKQQRKEIEILFNDKRLFQNDTLPKLKDEILQMGNIVTVHAKECNDKQIAPIKKRLKVIEDEHLSENGSKTGVKEWRAEIYATVIVIIALINAFWHKITFIFPKGGN